MRLRTAFVLAAVCLLLLAGTVSAYGADVTVECGKKKTTNFTSINTALATLSKQGPNTIHVSGPCKEAVVIDGYEDLTVTGSGPSASISDPTPSNLEDNDVVDIVQSRNVTVQGLTINGGINGVGCFQFSVCYLRELTIQGAASVGVFFGRSSGFVDNTVIQNNLFSGVTVAQGSNIVLGSALFGTAGTATIQNNGNATDGGNGIDVVNGSNLTLITVTIQGHAGGSGVNVDFDSFARVFEVTITGNAGDGMSVGEGSVLRLQNSGTGIPNTITGNGGNGIRVGHLSFLRLQGPRTVSGNGSPDVNCQFSTAKTQGVINLGTGLPNLGGGTTNCTEPAP